MVRSQPGQIVHRPYLEKTHHERDGGVAQSAGPEFKSQYHRKGGKRQEQSPFLSLNISTFIIVQILHYTGTLWL
jgi:hypothetical protein